MSGIVTIKMRNGRKVKIDHDTYQAICRAVRIYREDRRIASLVALPSEGITEEIVSEIRSKMIIRGDLPARSYARSLAVAQNHV